MSLYESPFGKNGLILKMRVLNILKKGKAKKFLLFSDGENPCSYVYVFTSKKIEAYYREDESPVPTNKYFSYQFHTEKLDLDGPEMVSPTRDFYSLFCSAWEDLLNDKAVMVFEGGK